MKKIIYLSIAFFVLSACQKEEAGTTTYAPSDVPAVFVAAMEDAPATKIHTGEYDGKYRVLWDGYTDVVAMCAGLDASSKYRVKGATANTPVANLYAEKDSDVATEGNAIPDNVAYYPYPNTSKVGDVTVVSNGDGSYKVPGAFSDAQTYLAGSIPSRGFPIVAVSDGLEDHTLNFKNVAGGICFNVKGGARVKSISFKSNEADKVIAGSADIIVSNTDLEASVPTYEFTGSSKTITLNCGAAVVTDSDETTPFYMGVAPQEFPLGFTVSINDEDFTWTVSTSKSQTVNRSRVLNMPTVTFPIKEFDLSAPKGIGNGAAYDPETQVLQFTGTSNRYIEFSVSDVALSDCKYLGLITDNCNCCLKFEFYAKGKYSTASHTWSWYTPGVQTSYYKKVSELPAELINVFNEEEIDRIRIGLNTNVSVEGTPTVHLSRLVLY